MNTLIFWIVLIMTCIVCGAICGDIASKKGHGFGGNFALGFFFNFLGVLYVIGIPETLELRIEQAIAIYEALEEHKHEVEMGVLAKEAAARREETRRRAAQKEWDEGVDDALDFE